MNPVILVPVKDAVKAKSRMSPLLNADERAAVACALLEDLIHSLLPIPCPVVVVSKAEGCPIRLDTVVPSAQARAWAAEYQKDARVVEVVLQQARRVVRMDRGILIAETHHGFVCANAGVDTSECPGTVVLLPPDPDKSADGLRRVLEAALRRQAGIIISDTFGRPWRMGLTNVALGVSGLSPFIDYRGQVDSYGRSLQAIMLATADELAGAAELVRGKTAGIPAAAIEGFRSGSAEGRGRVLYRIVPEHISTIG
jgi:coenzyme F420-0:L-glutamate ligase/coenzyme F420-1:gamma-L-glutamate ligase